jgi:hydrogenase/urease accessory protein HupE
MRRLLPILLALAAAPAAAHEGHHETLTFAEQVRHLLSQPDPQLALAGLVVLAVAAGWSWRRAKVRR